jgi:phosphoglycolate phosphatase-like HAD superfamily hydrolase
MLRLEKYHTLIFDCDGVVLDSNRIKTEAFRTAALPYGKIAAQALVDYHLLHGGVSRFVKFAHFLDKIVTAHATTQTGPDLQGLLDIYADAVLSGLMTCPVAQGLNALRLATPQARWLIVSGGDQRELRAVFSARNIMRYFDGGIFGSPETKSVILAREIKAGTIERPAVFFGDSRVDCEAATEAELEFVFVTDWSEWAGGARLAKQAGFEMVRSLAHLLES